LSWASKGLARWHRYAVEGFEHLVDGPPGLIVGYHGRPLSWDIVFLGLKLHEVTGRYPAPFVAGAFDTVPWLGAWMERIDAQYGEPDPDVVARVRAKGRHFIVAPGGMREGLRPAWRGRYTLDFGERRGYCYCSFALRHGLPIYPVVATGVDAAWLNLVDGYRLSKRVFGHGRVPIIVSAGLGGLFPFAVPIPVRVRQRVGAPIDVAEVAREADPVEALHQRITSTMQAMLDELRRRG
jgi:1-acyl-sn-glycerol-3-phosphate acyltransferase